VGEVVTEVGGADRTALPRVAVAYDAASFSPMVLAEAAAGTCRLVWVVDGSDAVMAPLVRLLRRIGDVVDTAGIGARSIATALGVHEPAGILTFSEAQMPLTAALAKRLSLTYHSVPTADRLADKYLQRRALRQAGLPGPAVWEPPSPDLGSEEYARAVAALADNVTFPVVVKPRRGASSIATARADDRRQLAHLLGRFGAREGGLLVEEYLADRDNGGPFADDMAVELLLQGGRVWRLATTGKFKHAPPFRGRGCFLPSHLDPWTEAELFGAAEAAVRALGVTDGFANVDIKLTPEGPRIVEVNGRLGGNVQVMMELAGGPPIMPLVFGLALGHDMDAEPALARLARLAEGRWPRVGYFAWIQTPMSATRLSGVEGLDDVAALPHVSNVVRNQRQGDPLDWAMGGRSNVCEVFGSVENVADLVAARDQIDDAITLEFDEAPAETGSSTAP
jgi:hypothetical protein